MNDLTEDLDALFEEIAAQHAVAAEPKAVATESVSAATANVAATDAESAQEHSPANSPMFDRLGHIVRQLHDSLRELGYDRSLSDVVTEVTDAAGRLEYIATLTEQAANKVLNSIDEAMPVQDALIQTAKDVEGRWDQLFDGKLGLDEFKLLAQDSRRFAGTVADNGEAEKARLMEIMMAQDFQDITGQIIKKVVTITQKLERELAQLLIDNAPQSTREKEKVVDLLAGPDVPTSALAQTDVDDLLADLGF
ncbi:protein phosphatase CheZ|uniref:protein phosphatase CheZ n=1 Tax=Noviherbaspirillum sp. L7-7A TaxID=2850560 RepID=UPI001C2BD18F|nr:protein phosphatase CheZ [Noviherbaspirillum sp. L7-7A]MBV0878997.1 protein phosphatase CheZ [Noviherbaspirillum sp. L7-7A]